ncbi:MAG TPA: DNA repair protein RecO [Bacteroidia bacterium]|jgi:DNA repair protein RecO (recombination protein O)|nr:DNA repair protein RecO [Bacteroidia bacterium]
MLHRTSGIIIHTVKYSESSLIARIYTSEFGIQSYMVSGVRGKKSKNKSALFQPLSLVDLIVSNSNKTGLHRISEISLLHPFNDIPKNIIKSTIVIFLNEILYKVLKEEHPDLPLFEYIKQALLILDMKQENCANFHIYFLIQLCSYLGFAPHGKPDHINKFFDLKEGQFIPEITSHLYFLNEENTTNFYEFMNAGTEDFHLIQINRFQRKELLQALIYYYQFHIASFGELKSLSVLEEITA